MPSTSTAPAAVGSAPTRSLRERITPHTLVVIVLRLAGAALLGTNAWIHGHLYSLGYRNIPTVGTLFLVDAVAAWVLAAAVVAAPRKFLAPVAALGALLELGTVLGLYIATEHELFGFTESSKASYYWESAITELVGTVVLAILVAVTLRQAWFRKARRGSASPRW